MIHAALELGGCDIAEVEAARLPRAGRVAGRGGQHPSAYATVGGTPLAEDDLRREVEDVIDVARLLWHSWEDDTVIRDVDSGRFLDADRVHHVNFTGARFSVVGPLITPRPPQGVPELQERGLYRTEYTGMTLREHLELP